MVWSTILRGLESPIVKMGGKSREVRKLNFMISVFFVLIFIKFLSVKILKQFRSSWRLLSSWLRPYPVCSAYSRGLGRSDISILTRALLRLTERALDATSIYLTVWCVILVCSSCGFVFCIQWTLVSINPYFILTPSLCRIYYYYYYYYQMLSLS